MKCSCSVEGSRSGAWDGWGENVQPGKIQDKPWSFAQHQIGLCRDMSEQLTHRLEVPEGLSRVPDQT